MQSLVGIVRTENEMARALDEIAKLKARAANVGVPGNREYNPGWHTAIDLANLLIVSEAVTRSALERPESRGAQFREDYPDKSEECAKFNTVVRAGAGERMQVVRQPVVPLRADLKQVIEENK
jgi:succinate dehydrogenase / fumarate reductase flavoprotein subunit